MMQPITLRWANRSTATQDWAISNGDNFTLQPDHTRHANLNLHGSFTYQISVDTNTPRFAAAALVYTAATQTWALNSNSPNEWQLAVGNGIVTVRCLLT